MMSAMPSKCCDERRTARHDSTLSSSQFEWAKQDTTPADYALELMVFDPTKTREKSTILHQLTDGNWFVSNADQQLVKFMSFENEYVKCFGTKIARQWNLIARATTTTCATASLMWWREFCLEYNLKIGNGFSSTQMVIPVVICWSRWGIYMRSHLQGSSTLSRDVRISSNVIDHPCHSWMRERTGWTTCQIVKWRGLWPIQTDESKVRRCWIFWDD